MHYFHWIAGTILALTWFSRIVDAAIGMPSVADVSKPEWDRNPVRASGNPRVSIIVPARNEEDHIEQSLTRLLELDYDNYEVIAVNDRSTDRTGEIMERVSESRHPSAPLRAGSDHGVFLTILSVISGPRRDFPVRYCSSGFCRWSRIFLQAARVVEIPDRSHQKEKQKDQMLDQCRHRGRNIQLASRFSPTVYRAMGKA